MRPDAPPIDPKSPGFWLQAIAIAHAGVGIGVYREPLADAIRDGFVGEFPDFGDRATGFWFMASSPALMAAGGLLRSVEAAGDRNAMSQAGVLLTLLGVLGGAAYPRSGFWGVAATGVETLRRVRRAPYRSLP